MAAHVPGESLWVVTVWFAILRMFVGLFVLVVMGLRSLNKGRLRELV